LCPTDRNHTTLLAHDEAVAPASRQADLPATLVPPEMYLGSLIRVFPNRMKKGAVARITRRRAPRPAPIGNFRRSASFRQLRTCRRIGIGQRCCHKRL